MSRLLDGRDLTDRLLGGYEMFPPPDHGGWSWVNQGTATVEQAADGPITVTVPLKGANAMTGYVRAIPAAPFTLTAYMDGFGFGGNGGFGLACVSATGQITVMYPRPATPVENWTNATTFSGSVGSSGVKLMPPICQIEDDNTNLIFRVASPITPTTFITVATVGRTSFLTGGPTLIGMMCRDNGANSGMRLRSWHVV